VLSAKLGCHCRAPPSDPEIPDIVPVDLIQRRIFRAAFIAAVIRPLAASRSSLSLRGHIQQEQSGPQNAIPHATAHKFLRWLIDVARLYGDGCLNYLNSLKNPWKEFR
jgi:hypothetical protein